MVQLILFSLVKLATAAAAVHVFGIPMVSRFTFDTFHSESVTAVSSAATAPSFPEIPTTVFFCL